MVLLGRKAQWQLDRIVLLMLVDKRARGHSKECRHGFKPIIFNGAPERVIEIRRKRNIG
jgi:hypothetical protein